MKWFYSIDGDIFGPVEHEKIISMIHSSELSYSDYASRSPCEKWAKLGDIPDFSAAFNVKSQTAYEKFKGNRAGEEKTTEIAKGVEMIFCWCPPGDFMMGIDFNQLWVSLSKGFWMAKTQVTQKQWEAVMGSNPSYFRGDNLPVEKVSWSDAQEFLEKLNTLIGNGDGGEMVLPTEAQWEYACLARETGDYSGGTINQVAWYRENSGKKTRPVGTKKPNLWGLHDMHGNVWEWCQDRYDDNLPGGVDPRGASSGRQRVFRGGGWSSGSHGCSAWYRSGFNSSDSNNNVGFRVARSLVS